ncbi:AraC family transcriptional regulator [Paracoccus versutus]|uniref:AraC family transcriptional regulator n=1 Tax=Paracoccus versutus TaxID=34007 RepID=UPI000DF840CC|nr:AraC family transcriptional regulator [Paracoccus versutus]RDD68530.1 AraC family transcriptional regulator [Paracoccus versutus]
MQANRYHHLGWHHGIELFEAAFSHQTFGRHAHEGFAIGAIAEGAGGYVCRGETMVLPAGTLSLMNPEEPHTGHAAADRVRYTMLYASEAAVRAVLGLRVLRGFAAIAPRDRGLRLGRALAHLAHCLNASPSPDWRLAAEEAAHGALALAFGQYGRAELRPAGDEPAAVRAVRARIAAGVEAGEALALADLAAEVGLNPSYLIRSMRRATGLTPHAHVLQARIGHARRLLLEGVPAAEAAVAAGFCDQAHLIRQFRRHLGVTPGALLRH